MSTIGVGPALIDTNSVSPSASSWRPPQWGGSPWYFITVPTTATSGGKVYVLTPLRVMHELALRRTEHPVQSGAAITDHAYVLPVKVILEVGVSDSMDTYTAGMWGGSSSSTSVNAFDALRELVRQRVLVTVQTRLRSYNNMLVESVGAEETSRTIAAGKFTVVFSEIFIAGTQVVTATARSDTSSVSSKGTVTAAPTLQQIQQMYGTLPDGTIPYTGYVGMTTASTVIGAGTASSYPMPSGRILSSTVGAL